MSSELELMVSLPRFNLKENDPRLFFPTRKVAITRPVQLQSVAFSAAFKDEALRHLNLSGWRYRIVPTNVRNVGLLVDEDFNGFNSFRVFDENEHRDSYYSSRFMMNWNPIKQVLKEFANRLGIEIAVRDGTGRTLVCRTSPGKLYIRFYALPPSSLPINTKKTTLLQAFGINLLNLQARALSPLGQGIVIYDNEGHPVAELIEGTLYILFDLNESHNCAELLRNIMEKVEDYLAPPVILGEDQFSSTQTVGQIQLETPEESRQAYIQICNQGRVLERRTIEQEVESLNRRVEEAQAQLTQAIQDERMTAEKLQLINQTDDSKLRYGREFDQIGKFDSVEKITVEKDCIKVYTTEIEISYQRQIYGLGKYRIEIHPSSGDDRVRCYSLKRPPFIEYHHPHIDRDGRCCLGNIKEGVRKLIAQAEFAPLVQLMINFLKTYNDVTPYTTIKNWPSRPQRRG